MEMSISTLNSYEFIDLHYHAAPDLYDRRMDAINAARSYKELGGAVALRSHLGATSIHATLCQKNSLPAFATLSLNNANGGNNYKSILNALSNYQTEITYNLIVDFATIKPTKHTSLLSRKLCNPESSKSLLQPLSLLTTTGKLKRNVLDVMKLAKDHPIVLSSGHSSKEEIFALIDACIKLNIRKFILNQPANPQTGLTAEELVTLSKHNFLWIEQTALTLLLKYQSYEDCSIVLNEIPNAFWSSDLGQTTQPDIKEWRSLTKTLFKKFNITPTRANEICKRNPEILLSPSL